MSLNEIKLMCRAKKLVSSGTCHSSSTAASARTPPTYSNSFPFILPHQLLSTASPQRRHPENYSAMPLQSTPSLHPAIDCLDTAHKLFLWIPLSSIAVLEQSLPAVGAWLANHAKPTSQYTLHG